MNYILGVGLGIIGLSIIFALLYKKSVIDKKIEELKNMEDEQLKGQIKAKEIIKNAESEALIVKKDIELKAKEIAYQIKEEAEKEIKASKNEILQKELRITRKEENIDNKLEKIEQKTLELEKQEEVLEEKLQEIENLKLKEEEELEKISGLSKNEAKELLISKLKDSLTHETAMVIKDYEARLEETKEDMAKRIISTAIGKAASEYVVDSTVSVVNLPNDEMKGRIIGREGRNIRTIESLTGVDVIIDDTPEAVVLSSYDGVKREVARRAIDKLISDGRIHPGKIEELVNKARKEIEKDIIDAGEQAILEVGVQGLHPEIVKTLGKLKYRTSYGQNVLVHSIEVAKLCGVLAAELGCNVKLAKRAGLLHDIGKVLDHETESSHAIIGGEFLRKFGEKEEVINAVMAHHNEVEKKTVEAVLVQAADAVSASRPGSRRETLSAYLKRLASLEEIANSFKGVESSYAIQAGREMRIIVNPETISDDEAIIMAREMAKKIEDTMQYPGQIKVTILRETRATEYAR
ncbi:MAG: ribonuclease Y [Fusobacterium perfoetens]|uniref:ribonuclease Y n=1 Tax=Fusobacterium perfoetens TaxID=852 RepID=UPI0023F067D2|nr:ribonuclease Y [Fusobacterium perfoetens]MCI6151801.1 ribonuclease Y [Fusobacterium perfoetens]MDY3236838.1 ribonuclease Y [Fusobacterium perfoetens]